MVKGAYMYEEAHVAKQQGTEYPIMSSKTETDLNYTTNMKTLFKNLGKDDEFLLGTHLPECAFEMIQMIETEGQEQHRKNIVFA